MQVELNLTFLGVGNASAQELGNASVVLEGAAGAPLLQIDCGPLALPAFEKRYAMLRRFHALIHDDQPLTCLYSLATLVAVNKRWRNVKIHKTGPFFYEWWLPPENRKPSDEVPEE